MRPTMTVYSPEKVNTGVAIVVFPGGGFEGLAIKGEGTDVCDWLTSKGITCVLLRYRVLQRLLIGNGHPLVPLRGLRLEALDHLERITVAGLGGIALIAGAGKRCRQANQGGRDGRFQHDAHYGLSAQGASEAI